MALDMCFRGVLVERGGKQAPKMAFAKRRTKKFLRGGDFPHAPRKACKRQAKPKLTYYRKSVAYWIEPASVIKID